MKRKLIKYELMATARLYLPLYLVMAVFALLGRFTLWQLPWQVVQKEDLSGWTNFSVEITGSGSGLMGEILGILASFIMLLYVLVVLGALVVHFIITLQRFWKNLLGDEGYLVFTLPVTTGDILWAKAATVFLWGIATTLMVIAAILILLWHPQLVQALRLELSQITPDAWARIREMLRHIFPPVLRLLLGVEFLVNSFGGTFLLYASMAMGHTVKRHKVLASLGSYAAISMVVGTVASFLMGLLMPSFAAATGELDLFMSTPELLLFARQMGDFLTAIWVLVLVIDLATTIGSFLLARYLLNTQLNLE